jgi:glycerol-3-phosphate dehydrogenase
MTSGAFDRATAIGRLGTDEFDVLVVGGGITGAGVALDAASRGLRTALVERHDFASGTSSKSSKLVHGGLRYLQQREVRLVYEALHERHIALRNAPHLVRVLPFLIPVLSKDGLVNPKLARALGSALWMYDLTGGVRIGKIHRRISKQRALEHMPSLRTANVAAAYLYYDAQTDDARLTLTIARTAAEHGAVVVNHARVDALHKDAGRLTGATVSVDGDTVEVRARAVVNATGVWSDEVRALDEGTHPHSIRPAKGIHITVPWHKVRNDIAAIIPVPKDRRSIFVVPWGDFTYVGTTDTDYDGPIDDPQCTPDDVRYLLDAVNLALDEPLSEADILGTWAGLRPLISGGSVGEKTADLSRKHAVRVSDSGLVTVTGGKLTTYRRMASDTVDRVVDALGTGGRCRTKRVRLVGAAGPTVSNEHLARRYGSLASDVLALETADPTLAEALVPGLPYRRSEAVYAVREEMARTLDDVLSRRTRARLLAREATARVADDVAALIGAELGWDATHIAREVGTFRSALAEERSAAGLPETALDESIGA